MALPAWIDPMNQYSKLSLYGDHYAMGRQHGRQVSQIRPLIAQAIKARFEQLEQDGPDMRFEALLRETRELLQEIDIPLLAMIRGQAEALAFEFDTLLRYDLVSYLRDDLVVRRALGNEGCTTWAASGSATFDGQPLLAKNRDYRQEHLPLQVVIQATPDSGYGYLYVSSAGSPGVYSAGINQAGLAVADTHVYSTNLGPGLPDYALMMHLLEAHDSVSSALDYLRSVRAWGAIISSWAMPWAIWPFLRVGAAAMDCSRPLTARWSIPITLSVLRCGIASSRWTRQRPEVALSVGTRPYTMNYRPLPVGSTSPLPGDSRLCTTALWRPSAVTQRRTPR
jgi:hypothetical protein